MLSPDAVFEDPTASALAGQRHALGMLEVVYASVARELSAYAVLVTGPAWQHRDRRPWHWTPNRAGLRLGRLIPAAHAQGHRHEPHLR